MGEIATGHVIPDEIVMKKIYVIRDKKVMMDKDLAELYDVEIKVLKQQVKRNMERFPEDFMFELSQYELQNLRSQFVTSSLPDSNAGWGGTRYLPMVFTEQGIAMLSSVLKSRRAIMINIQIIRVFTKIRELLQTHKEILSKLEQIQSKDIEQDKKIMLIFEYLNQPEKAKQKQFDSNNRPRVGFKPAHQQ
jgi:hypothetical protein